MNPVAIIADLFGYINARGNHSYAAKLTAIAKDGEIDEIVTEMRDNYPSRIGDVHRLAEHHWNISSAFPIRVREYKCSSWKQAKEMAGI